jgi:hypothetical protein
MAQELARRSVTGGNDNPPQHVLLGNKDAHHVGQEQARLAPPGLLETIEETSKRVVGSRNIRQYQRA